MEYDLLIARSITQGQHMLRVLERCGLRAVLFRTPAGLTGRGCSYAVRLRAEDLDAAQSCLNEAGVSPLGIYHRENGEYREVVR